MNINVSERNIDFYKIGLGDIVITASGEICLIAIDNDVDENEKCYLAINLSYNRADLSFFETIPELCKNIERDLDSPIIKWVLGSKVNLEV